MGQVPNSSVVGSRFLKIFAREVSAATGNNPLLSEALGDHDVLAAIEGIRWQGDFASSRDGTDRVADCIEDFVGYQSRQLHLDVDIRNWRSECRHALLKARRLISE